MEPGKAMVALNRVGDDTSWGRPNRIVADTGVVLVGRRRVVVWSGVIHDITQEIGAVGLLVLRAEPRQFSKPKTMLLDLVADFVEGCESVHREVLLRIVFPALDGRKDVFVGGAVGIDLEGPARSGSILQMNPLTMRSRVCPLLQLGLLPSGEWRIHHRPRQRRRLHEPLHYPRCLPLLTNLISWGLSIPHLALPLLRPRQTLSARCPQHLPGQDLFKFSPLRWR